MSGFPTPTGPAAGGSLGPEHAAEARRGPSYGRALLATLVWAALSIVALFVFLGPPGSSEAAGRAVGALLIPSLLAALVTWRLARRVATRSFWQLVLLALPAFLVLRLLLGALQAVGGSAG